MAKSNKKFMILSAIGIIMVVDSHTWGTFNIFANFFPFNSFFMPMFVLISGYFNKVDTKTNMWKYTVRKFQTLLLPYIVVSILALIAEWLMLCIKTEAMQPFMLEYKAKAMLNIFTSGEITTIALPMWFAPMLFAVQIVYGFMKKLFANHWNSKIMVIPFIILNIAVVWYAKDHEVPDYLLLPLKVLFFLPFMEMGVLYREGLEEKIQKINPLLLLFSMLTINMIRVFFMPQEYDLAFDSMATLAISENTFYIMSLHVVCFNILNCILFGINKVAGLPYFDVEAFQDSNWYRWEYVSQFKLVYFLAGTLGPVGLVMLYNKFIKKPVCGLFKKPAEQK